MTILVFSGCTSNSESAAIITGAVTHEQIRAAHSWLGALFRERAGDVLYSFSLRN